MVLFTRLATRETLRTAYARCIVCSRHPYPYDIDIGLGEPALVRRSLRWQGLHRHLSQKAGEYHCAPDDSPQSQPARGKMGSRRGGTSRRDARDHGLIYQAAAAGPGDTIEKLMFILLRHTNSVVSCCVVSIARPTSQVSDRAGGILHTAQKRVLPVPVQRTVQPL